MNSQVTSQSDSPTARPLWLADLTLLLVAIIWGVNIPVMKVALHQIDAYAFNAIRLVVSSAVLIYFARREFLNGIQPARTLSKRDVCIYASIVSMAYQLLFLLAISHATSADVALIMATVPMWTAIGARFFLKEILPLMAWVGLIIAFSGTMIVTLHKAPTPMIGSKVVIDGEVIAETSGPALDLLSRPTAEKPAPRNATRPALTPQEETSNSTSAKPRGDCPEICSRCRPHLHGRGARSLVARCWGKSPPFNCLHVPPRWVCLFTSSLRW